MGAFQDTVYIFIYIELSVACSSCGLYYEVALSYRFFRLSV